MQNIHSLVNHFLIAMPAMDDPCFGKTLIYIAEHNSNGALGLIVNRPTDLDLATLLDRASIAVTPARMAALSGGPALLVGELSRHGGEWKFNAVGAGYQGGLEALCRAYGVNV